MLRENGTLEEFSLTNLALLHTCTFRMPLRSCIISTTFSPDYVWVASAFAVEKYQIHPPLEDPIVSLRGDPGCVAYCGPNFTKSSKHVFCGWDNDVGPGAREVKIKRYNCETGEVLCSCIVPAKLYQFRVASRSLLSDDESRLILIIHRNIGIYCTSDLSLLELFDSGITNWQIFLTINTQGIESISSDVDRRQVNLWERSCKGREARNLGHNEYRVAKKQAVAAMDRLAAIDSKDFWVDSESGVKCVFGDRKLMAVAWSRLPYVSYHSTTHVPTEDRRQAISRLIVRIRTKVSTVVEIHLIMEVYPHYFRTII